MWRVDKPQVRPARGFPMSEIKTIHTSCKNCVFAKYDNITQTACELNYIEKYKKNNIAILEVYDEDKEFYVINDKKCIGYRENKWFNQYGLEHASLEKKIQKFQELNNIQYLLVIDLKYFSKNDLSDLKNQISCCIIKPQKIIIIRYRNTSDDFKYDNIKNLFDGDDIKCKWRIQTMVDESLTHEDILYNITNMNKGYRFIVDIRHPNGDLNKIVNETNKIVYSDLNQIDAVANHNKSIVLFSAPSYRWSFVVQHKDILMDDNSYLII